MTLHARETIRDQLLDCVYASLELNEDIPKYKFPDGQVRPEDVFQVISDELILDGNARQNLATFCQTWEEPQVHALMDLAMDKNMIDRDEYPQTAELERRCVHMLADLWNAPDAGNAVGCSAIGSSEACMLGGMAAKWRWRAKRAAEGKPTDKPNMVCGPVQVVWHKFAKYWDVEIREIPMSKDHYCMDVDEMLKRIDENTIMVVPTFGVTYTGSYEPVQEIALALDRLERRNRARRPDPRRWRLGGFSGSVLRPRHPMGLPPAPGEVHQYLRSQIRPGAAWGGLGAVARRR